MATTPHVSLWVIPGVHLRNSQLALFFSLLGEFDSQVWEWFNSPLTVANLQENSCRKQTNKLIIWCSISLEHQTKPLGTAQLLGLANTGDWGEGAVKQTPELCHSLGELAWFPPVINLPVGFRNMLWKKKTHTKANSKLKFTFKNFDVH